MRGHRVRLAALAIAVATTAAASACGPAAQDEENGFWPTVDAFRAYGPSTVEPPTPGDYLREDGGVGHGVEGAVAFLLEDDGPVGPGGDYRSFWTGPCTPGRMLDHIAVRGAVVDVFLRGVVPQHEQCKLTREQFIVQQQQLAWTVRDSLDPFWSCDPPLVRLTAGGGTRWEATADPTFIDPVSRRLESSGADSTSGACP